MGGLRDDLPTIMEEPWGLAVKLDERDGAWGKFMARRWKNGTAPAS